MKYSFLENNDRDINKKHLLEYDQFADDEEYDSDDTYDPKVDAMIEKKVEEIREKYKLRDVDELNNILIDDDISLEEKENYIRYNKDLIDEVGEVIEEVLNGMKDEASGVMFYGVESAGIVDLMELVEADLEKDYYEADEEGDEETKKLIENEMERVENEASECCRKIINAIDSVLPVSMLSVTQKLRLYYEIQELEAYGQRAEENPHAFVNLVIGYFISDDEQPLKKIEFACSNALEE